ncbi:MAG: glycosyltransferase family 4 protein [Bacteroidia bacterium]
MPLPKILVWVQYYFYFPGGWGNSRSWDILRLWKSQGYKVLVLASDIYVLSKPLSTKLSMEGIDVHLFPAGHRGAGYLRRVMRWMSFLGFVLWHLRRFKEATYVGVAIPPLPLAWAIAFLPASWRKKIFLEVYDAWPAVWAVFPRLRIFLPLAERLTRWSYGRFRKIVVLSPGIQDYLKSLGIQEMHMSYNGTDTALFRPMGRSWLPFEMVYAGSISRIYGLEFLLEVMGLLRKWAGIRLHVIGDGPCRSRLEKLAQKNGLRIFFWGAVEKRLLGNVLGRMHIGVSCVMPVSVLETNSANKFYDYAAAGLVIGLNYGGWQAWQVEKWGVGFWEKDPRAFAERVVFYYLDRRAWARASDTAVQVAKLYFDRRKLGRKLQAYLKDGPEGASTSREGDMRSS